MTSRRPILESLKARHSSGLAGIAQRGGDEILLVDLERTSYEGVEVLRETAFLKQLGSPASNSGA
jgi:hypothetical protein